VTAGRTSGLLLAIDTATARVVLALGAGDGTLLAAETWTAGHRHVEELLPRLDALLEDQGLDRRSLAAMAGIVVGTGPGAFTGLRVGLATAKALAVAFDLPLAAVGTGVALLAAAEAADPASGAERLVLLLSAGPGGRYLVTPTGTQLVTDAEPLDLPASAVIIAVDLPGRAPDVALARGEAASDQFPGAILRLGAARLSAGLADDPAGVVPEYVSLPRGAHAGAVSPAQTPWSPALR
jgi:tRNA threonylcarbamoyl adenosine modification protein YeaZ